MDTKALAKSKRAHSQHHSKKHHPNPTLKAPLVGQVGASGAKKQSGKQVREKPNESKGFSALPSNWDRYEEEYDSGSEDPSHNITSQTTDFVPKSKGADYGYLISEAMSQSHTNISSDSESFPSFGDVLTAMGVGSLLSVRGQGILSWTRDDNFVVEDRATTSHEASFLSLNLHLLAEQLSKVDLSQRLFIEQDCLLPELCFHISYSLDTNKWFPLVLINCTEEIQTSFNRESDQVQVACQSEVVVINSDELVDKMEDQISDFMSPNSSAIYDSVSTSFNKGLKSTDPIKDKQSQSRGTGESTVQYRAQSKGISVANPNEKSSRFEAAAAEADLDFLLDLGNEKNCLDSFGVKKTSTDTFSVEKQGTSSRLDSSKAASVTTHFDDALDDLLKETSSSGRFSVHQQETSTSLLGGNPYVHSAPAQHLRKGADLSKSASVTANFDDALDDLLKETSNRTNQKDTSQSHEVRVAQRNTMSSSSSGPVSKSKVLDDFDSWFDSNLTLDKHGPVNLDF
ncbi:unnamed protein product [Camellia sinensis]